MRKCIICNNVVNDDDSFCGVCGAKVESNCNELKNAENLKYNFDSKNNYERKSLDCFEDYENNNYSINEKKNFNIRKIIIFSILIAMIFIFLGYKQLGNYMSNPIKTVEKFEEAIIENDSKKLSSLLECSSKKLDINESSVKIILDYFENNPSYLDRIIWSLEKEAQTFGEESGVTELKDESDDVFYIDISSKSLFGIRECKIFIKPIFIALQYKADGVKFLMNDEEICISDKEYSRDLGPFMPGNYKLTYQYNNEFVELDESVNVDFIKEGKVSSNQLVYEIAPELRYVTLKVNEEAKNADVYIDGNKIDKKAGEIKEFGPLSEKNKIFIELDSNGKKIKSDEVEVSFYEEINIDLSTEIRDMKESKDKYPSVYESDYVDLYNMVEYLVKEYTYNFTLAVNNNNFGKIEKYLDPDGELYEEQSKVVEEFYEDGIKEELINTTIVEIDILNTAPELSGTVETIETYEISQGGEVKERTFNVLYGFKLNESMSEYTLTNIEYLDKVK